LLTKYVGGEGDLNRKLLVIDKGVVAAPSNQICYPVRSMGSPCADLYIQRLRSPVKQL
jgi:hypothetical protein